MRTQPAVRLPLLLAAIIVFILAVPVSSSQLSSGADDTRLLRRINAGGDTLIDAAGLLWFTDFGFNAGSPAETIPASVTIVDALDGTPVPAATDPRYRSCRKGADAGEDLIYSFKVIAPGPHVVRLHFADDSPVGTRFFSLGINGITVLPFLDSSATFGINAASWLAFETSVTSNLDPSITIKFDPILGEPFVCGIEIWEGTLDSVLGGRQIHKTTTTTTTRPTTTTTKKPTTTVTTTVTTTTKATTTTMITTTTADPYHLRVNCGGQAVEDIGDPPLWQKDAYFSGGRDLQFNDPVLGLTRPDRLLLFKTERNRPKNGFGSEDLSYTLPVPRAGKYALRLWFVETCSCASNPGDRIFNVRVQDKLALANYDILINAAFGTPTFVDLPVTISPSDTFEARVSLLRVKQAPKINAIEIFTVDVLPTTASPPVTDSQATKAPTTSTVTSTVAATSPDVTVAPSGGVEPAFALRLNAGGGQFRDESGALWLEDDLYAVGGRKFQTSDPINGLEDSSLLQLYQSERNIPKQGAGSEGLSYVLPVPEVGQYLIRLHFAEVCTCATRQGDRLFDVSLQGQPILNDFDIVAQAGFAVPHVFETVAIVTNADADGITGTYQIRLDFFRKKKGAKVSGIEVIDTVVTTTPTPTTTTTTPAPPLPDIDSPFFVPYVRLNCGTQSTLDDEEGVAWTADSGLDGIPESNQFSRKAPGNVIYKTARASPDPFEYTFNLEPSEIYRIELYFMELSAKAGLKKKKRNVYNVDLELGRVVSLSGNDEIVIPQTINLASPLNIVEETGSVLRSTTRQRLISGTRLLIVRLTPLKNEAIISGIAIDRYTAAGPTPTFPTTTAISVETYNLPNARLSAPRWRVLHRINCGGGLYVDERGQGWVPDYATSGGRPFTHPDTALLRTDAQRQLYLTELQEASKENPDIKYALTVPGRGRYRTKISLVELDTSAVNVGDRIFDIKVEGKTIARDLDLVKSKGFGRPLELQSKVKVRNNKINFVFKRKTKYPKVNAIQVWVDTKKYDFAPSLAFFDTVWVRNNQVSALKFELYDRNVKENKSNRFTVKVSAQAFTGLLSVKAGNAVSVNLNAGSVPDGFVFEVRLQVEQPKSNKDVYRFTKYLTVLHPSAYPVWTALPQDTSVYVSQMGGVTAVADKDAVYLFPWGKEQGIRIMSNERTGVARREIAAPPRVGSHYAADIIGNKVYVVGGYGKASGEVQIYDTVGDSWGLARAVPWSAGAMAVVNIGEELYACGGAVKDAVVSHCAKYIVESNSWVLLPSMPFAVEYAAAGTDGERLFIFGGRNTANTPSNGFDYVQVFIVGKNMWVTSETEPIAPLPFSRAGMSHRAVYANGEFYVVGGETQTGAGASSTGTYARVDIYNPASNSWREGPPLVQGVHGAGAVLAYGQLMIIGGLPSAFTASEARIAQQMTWVTPTTTTTITTTTTTTSTSTTSTTLDTTPKPTTTTTTTTPFTGPTRIRITTEGPGVTATTSRTTSAVAATTATTTTTDSKTAPATTAEELLPTSTMLPFTLPQTSAIGEEVLLMHRINCGSDALVKDPAGRLWSPDYGYNAGDVELNVGSAVATMDIYDIDAEGAGAGFPALYETSRMDFSKAAPELIYSLRVPQPGRYLLRLYFAEVSEDVQALGDRLMDLYIEGMLVQQSLDILALAGGRRRGHSLHLGVLVTDGVLNIEFRRDQRYTKVSGIELFAEPGGVPLPPMMLSAPPAVAQAGVKFVVNLTATDPNGDNLAFGLLEAQHAAGAILDAPFGTGYALLSWTPTAQVETAVFKIVVTDTSGLEDELTFDVRVQDGPILYDWSLDTLAPVSLAEVAGGIIGGRLYIVGQGDSRTLQYELASRTWLPANTPIGTSSMAGSPRPFAGNHHAAEVYRDRLYLVGGLDQQSIGKVQILDVTTGVWTQGATLPWPAGSVTTAVIAGHIYACGGIVGKVTVGYCAKYSLEMDRWTLLASMPRPVNHAAGATDGRRFWIFGGRGGDNAVSNGYDTVQVYDPVTATWATSLESTAPLPQARGGMGRAIYLNDEFYVMGGETATGAGATAANVYARVDVYNPATNTWRRVRDMDVARHGIYPVEDKGRIYVACGGDQAEASKTPVMEVFDLV